MKSTSRDKSASLLIKFICLSKSGKISMRLETMTSLLGLRGSPMKLMQDSYSVRKKLLVVQDLARLGTQSRFRNLTMT